MLKELHRERLYEAVAQELKRYIAESGLRPGDRLPSERSLCDQLKVGRTSLREGLRLLQMMGLVDIRPGLGAYVAPVHTGDLDAFLTRAVQPALDDSSDFLDLAEVRSFLETEAVRLAAQRRTDDDLAALDEKVRRDQQKVDTTGEYGWYDDYEFHRLLFHATRNRVLVRLLPLVEEFLHALEQVRRRALDREPTLTLHTTALETVAEHRAIADAVRAGDRTEAVRRMRYHIRGSTQGVLKTMVHKYDGAEEESP